MKYLYKIFIGRKINFFDDLLYFPMKVVPTFFKIFLLTIVLRTLVNMTHLIIMISINLHLL